MINEQQEIDDYIERVKEKWDEVDRLYRSVDDETQKAKLKEPILDLASLLENKGHRPADICDEIIHLLRSAIPNEVGNPPVSLGLAIRVLLRHTQFEPSANLKVYQGYVKDFSSKTAYIHEDVMARLGLSNTDDDNIIEIETKSDKRTVVNVLRLRDVDERNDIIRIGSVVNHANLGILKNHETVTIRKAIKPIPSDKIIVWSYPGQAPVGGYYLKRKLQGIPLWIEDMYVRTPSPNSDSRWLIFAIKTIYWDEKYIKDFGGVGMVTPETSFEEIIDEEAYRGKVISHERSICKLYLFVNSLFLNSHGFAFFLDFCTRFLYLNTTSADLRNLRRKMGFSTIPTYPVSIA